MGLISTSDCDSSHANLTLNGIFPRGAFSAPLTSGGAEFSPPTPNEVGSKGRYAYPASYFLFWRTAMREKKRLALYALLILLLMPLAPAQIYTVTDLGTLGGSSSGG